MRTNKIALTLFITLFLALAVNINLVSAEMDYHSQYDLSGYGINLRGIASNGTHLFIGDLGNTDIDVYLIDTNSLTPSFSFDTAASGNAHLAGLCTNNTHIFSFDSTDLRVYTYLTDGTYISSFVVTGVNIGAGCVNNTIWLASQTNGNMRRYFLNGTFINQINGVTAVNAGTASGARAYFYVEPDGVNIHSFKGDTTNAYWNKGFFNATLYPYSPSNFPYQNIGNAYGVTCDPTYCYVLKYGGYVYKYYHNTTFEPIQFSYPILITSPGYYNITAPISTASYPDIIKMWSDDIFINGNYYLITQSSVAASYNIVPIQNLDNITITNIYFRPNSATYSRGFIGNAGIYNLNNSNISNILFHTSYLANPSYQIFRVNIYNSIIENVTMPNVGYINLPSVFYRIYSSNLTNLNINYNSSYTVRSIFEDLIWDSQVTNSTFISQNNIIFGNTINNTLIENCTLKQINQSGTAADRYIFYGNIINSNITGNDIQQHYSGGNIFYSLNGTGSLVYNNLFGLNATANNVGTLAVGNDIAFNTTNSTGPNIIGGLYIGGNYYYSNTGVGFSQTCIDGDSDGFCDTNYTWGNSIDYLPLSSSFKIFSSSSSWWNNSAEYVNKNFSIVIEYDAGFINAPQARIEYNGTNYTMSAYYSGAANVTFYYNLKIPAVVASYNETRLIKYYFLDAGGNFLGSENNTQIVYKIIMSNSSTLATNILNITCRDEVTNALVAGCTVNPTFYVWAEPSYNLSGYFRSYNIPSSGASYYLFYKHPNATVTNLTYNLQSSAYATGYPLRTFSFSNKSANTSVGVITLYLLDSGSGIYTTFSVIDSLTGNALEGVYVKGTTTTLLGATAIVCEGYTDAAGTLTCWNNPNTEHTYIFTYGSYTKTYVIYPTQTSYTVSLGGTLDVNTTTPIDNTNFTISPPLTQSLNNNTNYVFWFNITGNGNLSEYGITIYGNNTVNLCSTSGSNAYGSNLSCSVNTANYTDIKMTYYYNQTNINGTVSGSFNWNVYRQYAGQYSIKTFFEDLKIFLNNPAFGNGTDGKFTLAIIAFAILLLMVGYLSYVSGIYSPFAIAGLIAAVTGFMSYVELMPAYGLAGHWTITFYLWIVLIAYLIFEHIK